MGGLMWTRRSLSKIAETLHIHGYKVSKTTLGKWLKSRNYSLRKNCKCIHQVSPPGRKEQMDAIEHLIAYCRIHDIPMISVDTKKKELIGWFANKGRILCKVPIAVNDHDLRGTRKTDVSQLRKPLEDALYLPYGQTCFRGHLIGPALDAV